jgi:cellulose synthase/poly-beta-1,6-N-acetylglucosamine synthase-like glycosyltransferase
MDDLRSAIDFLGSQSELSLVALFWYTLIFDIPRYVTVFVSLAIAQLFRRKADPPPAASLDMSRVTVIIVGHNEADAIERCVLSLQEQSVQGFEIVVVSDGSTDAMRQKSRELLHRGLIHRALATELRAGKPAGLNLAFSAAKGEFIVNVDCDCSFDRYAIENLLAPFSDPAIGATTGDILVRNPRQSLIARFQFIEYLFSISVGKQLDDALGIVKCVSGAFGAFRRSALQRVSGLDAGSGEDFDLTLRLRAAGWRVAFVSDAMCYTDVPATLWALFRQRLRWEGDTVGLRYRKHRGLMSATSSRFRVLETLHQWEFLVFNVLSALLLPVYVTWLFLLYGGFAVVVLLAMTVALTLLNMVLLLLAAIITDRHVFFSNLIYIPGFTVFNSYVMGTIRAIAYIEEWFRFRSRRDNYSPEKVRTLIRW